MDPRNQRRVFTYVYNVTLYMFDCRMFDEVDNLLSAFFVRCCQAVRQLSSACAARYAPQLAWTIVVIPNCIGLRLFACSVSRPFLPTPVLQKKRFSRILVKECLNATALAALHLAPRCILQLGLVYVDPAI